MSSSDIEELNNLNSRINCLRNFVLLLENNLENNLENDEEDENYSWMEFHYNDGINNRNLRAPGRRKKKKHISVQAVHDIKEINNPWLLEAEKKIEDFCAHLHNLMNVLYHTKNRDLKPVIRNTFSGKSHRPNFNSKSSVKVKLSDERSKNIENDSTFDVIVDRISFILQSVMKLKDSIPKSGSEKFENYSMQEYEIVKSKTEKKSSILKLERSKSSLYNRSYLPLADNKVKRGKTMPVTCVTEFVDKSHYYEKGKELNHKSSKTDKFCKMISDPKSNNLVKTKNTVPGNLRQPLHVQEKNLDCQDLKLPTRDTGAIPKNRNTQRLTNASNTIRTQKTKNTGSKPQWK